MSRILAQVTLPYSSGLPQDVSVNTWAFDTGGLGQDPIALGAITNGLVAFYDEVDELYSELIDSPYEIKLYDIDDPEPRAPISSLFQVWPDPGSNPLPEEVALCLSFRAAPVSGDPPARRRGRVYLGPFGTEAAGELNGRSAPAGIVLTVLIEAVTAAEAIWTGAGVEHCVWSRADDALYPVVQYWTDNAWDTQRRRGVDPTARLGVFPQ